MPRPVASRPRPLTDKAIVDEYILVHRPKLLAEMDWFGEGGLTLEAGIRRAAAATKRDGKRCSHQYRLGREVLARAAQALLDARRKLRKNMPFERLREIVEETIRPMPGVGPLYVYDTALRLGAHLKSKPEHVHLHAGARLGARALVGPARAREASIDPSALRDEYRRLEAFEIENLLCCYHKPLASRGGPGAP